jgi:Flp pilus assembly protein protease CpaA
MSAGTVVTSGLLSLVWITLAIQDLRVQKLSNVATLSAFALALGYRLRDDASGSYLLSLGVCSVVTLVIYATGTIGGGDAKLLLSILAWRPGIETWMVILACLVVIGGAALVWSRLRHNMAASRRYPLGGAISAAGLIVLWAL